MTKIKIKFITLGCKTNIYESEAMAELFRKRGHEMVENDEIADVCVINTCTVTGTGAQKSRQQIRRARNKNPNAIIAVTGCFAQTEPESVREIEGVDIIIGNKYRSQIVTLVENATKGLKTDRIENILVEHEYEELGSTNSQSRIRANIKIED
ncbi:MAG: tRNA (N(6)-L-threonylcarbamoyladenosine(37)-C(2))-methylthiotransferase MtaB, partial [Oscillospiraceae bacterium]